MRTWIYNRIKAILGDPTNWSLTSSGSADNPATPFIVITMGTEQPPPGMPASSRTQQIPFTAWVHDAPGSMVRIDEMAVSLKDGLPTADGAVVGGLSVLGCVWTDTGEDAYDDHYGTNTRPVRFLLTTRR